MQHGSNNLESRSSLFEFIRVCSARVGRSVEWGFHNLALQRYNRSCLSVMTVAELAHGIYRATTPERRERRRQFVDELKTHVPIHPITEATAEIIARVGGEQAAKGINLPFIDLMIGARALELGYAIGTDNTRDFGTPSGQHC